MGNAECTRKGHYKINLVGIISVAVQARGITYSPLRKPEHRSTLGVATQSEEK